MPGPESEPAPEPPSADASVSLRSGPGLGNSESPVNPSADMDGEGDGDGEADGDVDMDHEHARPRKRTRRACDKCSASRTRCDGECPCRRCKDYGYTCRYNREVKKRGRIPGTVSVRTTTPGSWGSPEAARQQPLPHQTHQAHDKDAGLRSPSVTSTRSPYPPISTAFLTPTKLPDDDDSARRDAHPPRLQQHHTPVPPNILPIVHPEAQPTTRFAHPHDVTSARRRPSGLGSAAPVESEVAASDESAGYPSPAPAVGAHDAPGHRSRQSFRSVIHADRDRGSFSTSATSGAEPFASDFLHKAPTEECCYRFLDPVLPYIRNIIPASVACDLLDIFLTDPGSSLFRGASPYILTRIFRKRSVTHPTNPRRTTPALLAAILWCVAQTADIMLLHVPGTRAKIVNDLYDLATSLIAERDPDGWRRIHGGLRAEQEIPHPHLRNPVTAPATTAANEPAGVIDDVLTFILLSIAVSGGDFKSDCVKWWSKATRLALSLRLNREDERCLATQDLSLSSIEHREERRRVFWLLYSLDRHLSLSFNSALSIPDSYCEVFIPLPEHVWENLDSIPLPDLPARVIGPPTTVTGTGFLEYFLPLMAILGDIIEVHHRREHPRLGGLDDTHSIVVIQELLSKYEQSLHNLTTEPDLTDRTLSPISRRYTDGSRLDLVRAYSTHILHVLHVLLHGKWDAICMLDDGDDWITSRRFTECAAHAISASQSVSTILQIDPELTFMSYLFGIYLLHGSFILLLFADRMPQLGPNESVEQACENIIRAHEVCVVTLSTEFQRNFRKVLRSTLYSVRSSGTTNWEEHRARRRALSLYRWTKGAKGLAL
ncbi:hypothetical protein B0I35DRAFT_373927, partial [Stachybotrys elegans]